MRYFLTAWALVVILFVGFMGPRGSLSRKPPIEVFPDMDRQMKLRPQVPFDFFPDNRSSRLPVEGTVARSRSFSNVQAGDGAPVFPYQDHPVTTGRMTVTGTTNFVETNPMSVTAEFVARGQQRFQIYCQPCHGPLADGNGVTKKLGMAVVANLHDTRIINMKDGELFNAISNGSVSTVMAGYASVLAVEDRWAIVAYLRALQLSRLGTIDDVPVPLRASLKK
jgi:hypothetical protein